MANTRDPAFTDLGVWAEDATVMPPIPANPLDTVAYRNEDFPQSENEEGELYNSITNSANFNQAMYIITKFITDINHHGTVGWSNEVDYIARSPTFVLAAITWADNGAFYEAVAESGPGTIAGIQDPALDVTETYWKKITSSGTLLLDLSSTVFNDEGARLVGTTYKPDALPAVEQTVQDSLNDLDTRAFHLHKTQVLMSATFDGNGIQDGAGFNVKDNLATQNTAGGVNFYTIKPATDFDFRTAKVEVTPLGTTGANSLFTFNQFVVTVFAGEVRITFSDPFNVNSTNNTIPFSIHVTTINPNISPNP